MGYSKVHVRDLEATLETIPADSVIDATPVDLSRLIRISKPIVNVDYHFEEHGQALSRILEEFEGQHL